MELVANFHLRYAKSAEQVKLVENQPFPHTLPTNGTAYYNQNGNTTGAGYDGPGECLRHVFGNGKRLYPSTGDVSAWWTRINNSEFITPNNLAQGYREGAWLFVPPQCEPPHTANSWPRLKDTRSGRCLGYYSEYPFV